MDPVELEFVMAGTEIVTWFKFEHFLRSRVYALAGEKIRRGVDLPCIHRKELTVHYRERMLGPNELDF